MTSLMPKISVIMPVYNAEKYLDRSISSILSQSFSDFELILVNDGSSDLSADICDNYAAIDPRVKVIHKPNGGVSSARNLGLDNASGQWICFVDSDDIVKPHAFQVLMDCTPADLIVSEYDFITVSGNHIFGQVAGDGRYSGTAIFDVVAQWPWMYWAAPWNKLFSANIIRENHLRYNTHITIEEDLVFNFRYLLHVHSMVTTAALTYSYCENVASSVHRSHSFESYRIRSLHLHEAISQLPVSAKIYAKYFSRHINAFPAMHSSDVSVEAKKEFIKWLKGIVTSNNISIKQIPGNKNKLSYISLKLFPARICTMLISWIY